MAEITLLSVAQAREGFEFIYNGGGPVCRTCPYRHACLTLDAGRKYAVTKVRTVTHPCALQETDAAVVEVKAVPRSVVVDSGSAIVGSSIEVARYPCQRLDCSSWWVCAGPALPAKQRYHVAAVDPEPAECLIGRTLKRVDAV
ncbi:MAG TPA: UPF0179 family protein [Thermoplasmata archaeon]|nr:UPF0179 family protein [Thermoplasmata archaeon]